MLFGAGLLAACADQAFEVREEFFGGVAVDEPRAAIIMRDVLESGGNAADAAVAGYFALAVTLPSSAGLSATGACMVFEPSTKRFEHLDFPPQPASESGKTVALPVGPRAMYALHARYGRQNVQGLIAKAEHLARFGIPVPDRLISDLQYVARHHDTVAVAPVLSDILARDAQSRMLVQTALAETLARLRQAGIGDFYAGESARSFADAVEAAGYQFDRGRLRMVRPQWGPVQTFEHDNHLWAVVAPYPVIQARAATALAGLFHDGLWTGVDAAGRARLVRDAIAADSTAKAVPRSPHDSPGATAFMIIDRTGRAVACTIGLGQPFGLGAIGVTGIVPRPATPGGPALALAVIAGNPNTWLTHLGSTANGGDAALSALLQTLLDHYEDGQTPEAALDRPRAHVDVSGRVLYVEPGWPAHEQATRGDAASAIEESPALGSVALFHCPEGIPQTAAKCDIAGDRRGGDLILLERK